VEFLIEALEHDAEAAFADDLLDFVMSEAAQMSGLGGRRQKLEFVRRAAVLLSLGRR